MWATKSKNQVYNLDKSSENIKRDRNAAQVEALKVKALLGAQKYHKDIIITSFLIDQKKRIGVALGQIDQELPNHPVPGQAAWQPQGLEALWNKYMDEKFAEAKSRTINTMDTLITELQNKYVKPDKVGGKNSDPFAIQIRRLATEWRKEKRAGWSKPAW